MIKTNVNITRYAQIMQITSVARSLNTRLTFIVFADHLQTDLMTQIRTDMLQSINHDVPG